MCNVHICIYIYIYICHQLFRISNRLWLDIASVTNRERRSVQDKSRPLLWMCARALSIRRFNKTNNVYLHIFWKYISININIHIKPKVSFRVHVVVPNGQVRKQVRPFFFHKHRKRQRKTVQAYVGLGGTTTFTKHQMHIKSMRIPYWYWGGSITLACYWIGTIPLRRSSAQPPWSFSPHAPRHLRAARGRSRSGPVSCHSYWVSYKT